MYPIEFDALTVIAWMIAMAWIAIIVVFIRACLQQSNLRPLGKKAGLDDYPKLSVIVAARNETDCIEACIRFRGCGGQ